MERAIVDILDADGDVTAIIGSGDNLKVFPNFVPQGEKMPAISFNRISTNPDHIKDGPALVDTGRLQIDLWDTKERGLDRLRDLATKVKTALNRTSGTFGGVVIDSINFEDDRDDFNKDADRHRIIQEYSVRHKP